MNLLGLLVEYAREQGLSLETEEQMITYKLTLSKDGPPVLTHLGKALKVARVLKDRSSGIEPRNGTDTVKYVLTPGKHFDAFWDLTESTAPSRALAAIRAFRTRKTWIKEIAKQVATLQKQNADLTFDGDECVAISVQGVKGYLHELPEFKAKPDLTETETECVVSGVRCRPIRLHPSVKGVPNTQKGRVPLVSYNASVYQFEGREQGNNCPVSAEVAMAYTAALSDMLTVVNYENARRRKRAIQLPDGRILVMWSNANLDPVLDVVTSYPSKANPKAMVEVWERFNALVPSEDPVHILILQGDSGRISILRWETQPFSRILEALRQLREDFRHATAFPCFLLLMSDLESERQRLDDVLKSRTYEAILLGGPLPLALYQFTVDRIVGLNEPQNHNHTWFSNMATKIAWMQSYRRRKNMPHHIPPTTKTDTEFPNESDYFPTNPTAAYQEGRWLALVEQLQFLYAIRFRRGGGPIKVGNPHGMKLREFATNTQRTKSEIQNRYLPLYHESVRRGPKAVYCFKALDEIVMELVNHPTPRRTTRDQEAAIGDGYYAQTLYLKHLGQAIKNGKTPEGGPSEESFEEVLENEDENSDTAAQ